MELPVPEINDMISDTINDTISDTIKDRLSRVILALFNNPGLKTNELAEKLAVSEITIKRDLQKMRSLVEYKGSKKTGGYFLTKKIMDRLKEQES